MFESISERFSGIFGRLMGKTRLTESNIDEALTEVRRALLDADVHFRVVRQFVENVKAKGVGQALIKGVRPGEQIIKMVHDELVALMGPEASPLELVRMHRRSSFVQPLFVPEPLLALFDATFCA